MEVEVCVYSSADDAARLIRRQNAHEVTSCGAVSAAGVSGAKQAEFLLEGLRGVWTEECRRRLCAEQIPPRPPSWAFDVDSLERLCPCQARKLRHRARQRRQTACDAVIVVPSDWTVGEIRVEERLLSK